ncbi:MAG: hypothetical protein ACTSO9_20900 [Candidatus Helarchaeota archaeon]
MDEYYMDLKKAVKALENYMATLSKDDYNYLKVKFDRIARVQKNFQF